MDDKKYIADAFIDNRNEVIDSGASTDKLKLFDLANIPLALYTIADILNDQNTLIAKQNELIKNQNKILTAIGSRIGGYRG